MNNELRYRKVTLLEYFLSIFALILSSYALLPMLREIFAGPYDVNDGDFFMQTLWFMIYVISILIIMFYRKYIILNLFNDLLLWLIIFTIFLSIYWSGNPSLTFRRAIAITLTQIFGIYLAYTFSWSNLLTIFKILFALSVSLSTFFILFLPQYSLDLKFIATYRGVYLHKNTFGLFMSLSILIWLYALLNSISKKIKRHLFLNTIFLFLSIVLLYLSKSKTSLLVLFLTLIITIFIRLLYSSKFRVITINLFILLFLLFFISFENNFNTILSFLGKDSTLTGRIPLWQMLSEYLRQKPFLGYGFSAFWSLPNQGASYIAQVLFESPNAHNGYLDIVIGLGLVGLAFYLCSIFKTLSLNLIQINKNKSYENFLPLSLLIFVSIYNLNESFLLIQNSFSWIIIVIISFKLRNDIVPHPVKNITTASVLTITENTEIDQKQTPIKNPAYKTTEIEWLATKKTEISFSKNSLPDNKISFIVIGKNQSNTIKKCLQSIFKACKYNHIKKREIIYVDSQSIDGTINIVKSDFPEVKIIKLTNKCTAAIGRNVGAKNSSGQILFFIDGDMELNKKFLQKIYSVENGLIENVVAGKIADYFYNPDFTKILNINPDRFNIKNDSYYSFLGGAYAIKRNLFFKNGGYTNNLKENEDKDFVLKLANLGIEVYYLNIKIVNHHTIEYNSCSRLWRRFIGGNMFYPAVIFRKYCFHKIYLKSLFKLQKSSFILIFSLISAWNLSSFFLIIYPLFILIKHLKTKPNITLIENILGTLLMNISFLLGIFFFHPRLIKDSEVTYILDNDKT